MSKNVIELRPLQYNAGLEKRYKREIGDLVNELIADTVRAVKGFLDTYNPKMPELVTMDESPYSINASLNAVRQKYDSKVSSAGKKIALRMAADQLRASNLAIKESIRSINPEDAKDKDSKELILLLLALVADDAFSQKVDIAKAQKPLRYLSPTMREAVQASLFQNIQYMKNIAADYLTKVTQSVMQNIMKGDLGQLKKEVVDLSRKAFNRSQLIAADQTRKAYQALTMRNMAEAGLTKFKWVYTYRSAEPRPFHRDVLNGQIFDIANPPVIDPKTGERGFPSQLPQCKCIMQPVIMGKE